MAVPSAVAGTVAAVAVYFIRDEIGTGRSGAAVALVVGALLGIAVFVAVASRMDIPEMRQLVAGVRRRRESASP